MDGWKIVVGAAFSMYKIHTSSASGLKTDQKPGHWTGSIIMEHTSGIQASFQELQLLCGPYIAISIVGVVSNSPFIYYILCSEICSSRH